MKKILSIAVLLMATLTGFNACNNDDESDDVQSLAKTTFTTTVHEDSPIMSGDFTYTVSFNDESECVMRVESKNIKALNSDQTFANDTYYSGTYTQNGNAITFDVDCVTYENAPHPFSDYDHPETLTFTYNPKGKELTAEDGLKLSSTNFAHLECKQYPPANAIAGIKLEDLVNAYWTVEHDNSYNQAQDVGTGFRVYPDGIMDFGIVVSDRNTGEILKEITCFDEPITLMGNGIEIAGWLIQFKSFSSDCMNEVSIYDPQGRLFAKVRKLTRTPIW